MALDIELNLSDQEYHSSARSDTQNSRISFVL